MEEKERSKKGRWCVSGHPGKLLRDEIVTSPGCRERDPASDSCGFKKRVPQCGTFVTLRMRHKGVAITPTQPRRQRTPLTRDGFTGRGEERVSHVRYATRDLLAVVFFATLFGALGVAETLPGFCKTEANTAC